MPCVLLIGFKEQYPHVDPAPETPSDLSEVFQLFFSSLSIAITHGRCRKNTIVKDPVKRRLVSISIKILGGKV